MTHIKRIGGLFCLLAASVFVWNGCATILKGSTETVSDRSDPSEAKGCVNGQLMGRTPPY
ncbi:MAG: hypothetical protein WB626_07930 [Bacteroidota bacterium]